MKRPGVSWIIFLLGLIPLALWQDALRSSLGDWLSFAVLVVYLLLLRLIGDGVMRALQRRTERDST
jgi:hypothetical protein